MQIWRPGASPRTSSGSPSAIYPSLRRRPHLLPCLPKAKCALPDRKGPPASGHICFVLSRAKECSVISTVDSQAVSTNIECDLGNTEDSFCNWIQLEGVKVVLVPTWRASPLRTQLHIQELCPEPSTSTHPSSGNIPPTVLRVHGAMSAQIPPIRTLLANCNRWSQRDER